MPTTDPVTKLGDANMAVDPETGAIAGIGHNHVGCEAEDFERALRRQIALNAERASLNAKIGRERKEMKSKGIALGHLDTVVRMLEWAPAEVRQHFAVVEQYARWAKLPLGTQIDLLAHATDEEVASQDWFARGFAAAVTGKGTFGVPPKECPPENHQDFLSGVTAGTVKIGGEMGADISEYEAG